MLIKQICQKSDTCHYWYFKDIGFKYESYLCNGCHDLMQKAMGFNNIAIVYVLMIIDDYWWLLMIIIDY